MISNIITDVHLLQIPVLRQTAVKIFKEPIKVCLQVLLGNLDALMRGVAVDVGQKDRLRKRRFDVLSGASVSVSACSDLRDDDIGQGKVLHP